MPGMEATGVVGHVGRKGLRFALADGSGVVPATVRHYGATSGSSVSGALSAFRADLSLVRLPSRLAIAVAGLPRGDAISITHTRWFVSRSGLQAMLGLAPLILNDFEAEAWALAGSNLAPLQPLGSSGAISLEQPGTYCVVGMTSGLGVSVLMRDASRTLSVLATEAGHAGFAPASSKMAELCALVFPGQWPVVAEHLVSANGLVAIYDALVAAQKLPKRQMAPEAITRQYGTDPFARQACDLLCEAFWTYVGHLVLTYGAWDGVIVTGGLAAILRTTLGSAAMQAAMIGTGKYVRQLATVPRALMSIENGELLGAAEALKRWS